MNDEINKKTDFVLLNNNTTTSMGEIIIKYKHRKKNEC